ncbi:hypothetical protein ACLB2K_059338 [Fragaria x ananassa]
MKIAVEGCMHGELDKVYSTLQYIERTQEIKIDLLLCCGDFQAVWNEHCMKSLTVPLKHRKMNSFWKYYSHHIFTIFGSSTTYGGWAAPNTYFLGFAGVVKFGNLRIGLEFIDQNTTD